MTDASHAPVQREAAVRELCDAVLSPAPPEQQAAASAAVALPPAAAAVGGVTGATNMPCWQVFGVAICRDDASVDAAWELMYARSVMWGRTGGALLEACFIVQCHETQPRVLAHSPGISSHSHAQGPLLLHMGRRRVPPDIRPALLSHRPVPLPRRPRPHLERAAARHGARSANRHWSTLPPSPPLPTCMSAHACLSMSL